MDPKCVCSAGLAVVAAAIIGVIICMSVSGNQNEHTVQNEDTVVIGDLIEQHGDTRSYALVTAAITSGTFFVTFLALSR